MILPRLGTERRASSGKVVTVFAPTTAGGEELMAMAKTLQIPGG